MQLFQDGTELWAKCNTCGFAGDGLDLLGAAWNAKSTEAVLKRLGEESSGIRRDNIPDEAVMRYQQDKARQRGLENFYSKCQEKVRKRDMDYRLSCALGVPKSGDPDWYRFYGRFFGYNTKDAVRANLKASPPGNHAILLPYNDLPGRLAGVRMFGLYRGKISHVDAFPQAGRQGGIFLLDELPHNTEFVFAIDDPLTALNIQYSSLSSVHQSFPVISYIPNTTDRWPVTTQQPIFWRRTPDPSVFMQARRTQNARIAFQGENCDADVLIREGRVHDWLHLAIKGAKPWAEALKDALLEMEMDDASLFAKAAEVTPMEAHEVLFHCTEREKIILRSVLSLDTLEQFEIVNGKKVIERHDGWWEIAHGNRTEQITNFTYRLTSTVYYEDLGGYAYGELTVGDRTEEFLAPMDKLSSAPDKWLRDFAMKTGIGTTRTTRAWKTALMDVAAAFNRLPTPHTTRTAHVGWSEDKSTFSFPNVTIKEGKKMAVPALPDGAGLPGRLASTAYLAPEDWKALGQVGMQPFLAVFAAIADCIAAPYYGSPHKTSVVIAPPTILTTVCSSMSLASLQARKLSATYDRDVAALEEHDLPVAITMLPKSGLVDEWLACAHGRNLLIGLPREKACTLHGPGWRFIQADNLFVPPSLLEKAPRLLLEFVRCVQTTDSPPKECSPKYCLELLARRASEFVTDAEAANIRGASKLSMHGSLYPLVSRQRQALYSLFDLIMAGVIDVSIGKKHGQVCIGESDVTVQRAHPVIHKLPWDTESSIDMRIEKEVWDDAYAEWRELTGNKGV